MTRSSYRIVSALSQSGRLTDASLVTITQTLLLFDGTVCCAALCVRVCPGGRGVGLREQLRRGFPYRAHRSRLTAEQ